MVKRPCPTYYKGGPSPIQRWIEHRILGGPLLLRCEDCGEHHIRATELTTTGAAKPDDAPEITLSRSDDTLTRARNCLRLAGMADPDRLGISISVAYWLEQYAKLDRDAAEMKGSEG